LPYEWFYLSLFSSITAYKFEIIHACFEIYSYHDKHSILVYLLTSLKLFILECFFFFFFFFFNYHKIDFFILFPVTVFAYVLEKQQ